MKRFALSVSLVLLLAPLSADWVAIPPPSFGIVEIAPAPNLWVSESTGSDFNPGTDPAKPRRTLPRALEAGLVVKVTGTQTTAFTSPNTIECHGTVDKPVWILGGTYTQGGEFSGSYCILEAEKPGSWFLTGRRDGKPSDHLVIRHGTGTGTYGTGNNFGSAPITDVVLWDIKGCGQYDGTQTEANGDRHGVTVGKRSQRIWILDSEFSKCLGDGVQVNGGQGGQDDTGPVYIGNLRADGNRQNGVGVKQSHDVVISGGHFANMRPDKDYTNPGAGIVAQYWPRRLGIVGVEIDHSENGIVIAGYDAAAMNAKESGVGIWSANIHDIRATRGKYDPANGRSPGNAIIFSGASERYVQDTTITDTDGGIALDHGTFDGKGNVLTRVGPSSVPTPTQPPPPVTPPPAPKPPTKPSLPACPHTLAGALGYLANRCVW